MFYVGKLKDEYRKEKKLSQKFMCSLYSEKLGTTYQSYTQYDSLEEAIEDLEEILFYLSENPEVKDAGDLIGYAAGISNGISIILKEFDSDD